MKAALQNISPQKFVHYGIEKGSIIDTKKINSFQRMSFDKPTPLDFDAFVPWICLEWQCPEIVTVTRDIQEDYVQIEQRRTSSIKSKSSKVIKLKQDIIAKNISASKPSTATSFLSKTEDNCIPIKALYDVKGHLVEILIVDCPFKIHRKVIQAFSLCSAFHSCLTKLSIRGGGLTASVLHEIGKFLPHSNLTDICLDDSLVAEANYHDLLEHVSELKNLSLKRCKINDMACKELATKIRFGSAGCTLLTLDLGSNLISDEGAHALGIALRRNRHLFHLNLSGNMITDTGALSILRHLMEFPLTRDEILDTRRRRVKYIENKAAVYAKCYQEVMNRRKNEQIASSITGRRSSTKTKGPKKHKSTHSAVFLNYCSTADVAEAMTKEIIGEFFDPFNIDDCVKRDGYFYNVGNMVLCSLNLASNNLEYMSIKKICEVLKYQNQIVKPEGATGLIRVIFVGNYVPTSCIDYVSIDMYLKKVVNELAPLLISTSALKKTNVTYAASKNSYLN